MTTEKEITPEDIARMRKGITKSQWVLMPDNRTFMIMWRFYEQFGIRHLETGEQYAIPYEDAIRQGIMPLILCPIDLSKLEI